MLWASLMMLLSGAGALAYEVVWLRQLTRAFGITVHAVSAVVALYMGGLALGAALASRLFPEGRPGKFAPIRAYAALEAAAAASAIAATWAMGRLPEWVARFGGEEPLAVGWRVLLAAPAMLPPTILLGATLPVLCRHIRRAGWLYAANTLGAVLGLAAAGFWTLGEWGEWGTVKAAVALNLGASLLALAVSRRPAPPQAPEAENRSRAILPFYALSGFCALGCEVLWSRQMIPILGNSSYAFSMVLAALLAGIAAGSAFGASWSRRAKPWPAFGALQLGLAGSILLSLYTFHRFGLALDDPAFLYFPLRRASDVARLALEAAVVVGPPALILGILFPITVATGAAVGEVYAANTLGGIAGSLAAGLWAVERFGVHASLLGLACLSAGIGLAALAKEGQLGRRVLVAAAGLACLGVYLRGDPMLEILSARLRRISPEPFHVLFHEDSAAATITGIGTPSGSSLYVNGIATAGIGVTGTFMAALPYALLESPGSILVICFGAGNTFRTASLLAPPGTEVHAVDIIAGLKRQMPAFYPDAARHLAAPGRRFFVEDGRQFLLRSPRLYSTIIVDAAPPLYSSGAVNLYTVEFMRLARKRLREGGIFVLWLPLPALAQDHGRIMSAMAEVFPELAVWASARWSGVFYLGGERAFRWPPGELERRIALRGLRQVLPDLDEAKLRSGLIPVDSAFRRYLASYPPLRDDLPVTEFPLPRLLAGQRFETGPVFLLQRPAGP